MLILTIIIYDQTSETAFITLDMPVCEGRATGLGQVQPCPESRNDETVRNRQGDLTLCNRCVEFRFPTVGCNVQSTSRQQTTTTTSKFGIDTVYTDNHIEKSTDFPECHITLNDVMCFIQNKYHNYRQL